MRHAGLLRAAATVNVSYLTLVTDNSMINIVVEQILLTTDGDSVSSQVKCFTHFRQLLRPNKSASRFSLILIVSLNLLLHLGMECNVCRGLNCFVEV